MKRSSLIIRYRIRLEQAVSRLGLGMRAKLIALFIVIKIVPLVLLAFVAWEQSSNMGSELRARTESLAATLDKTLIKTGEIAVADAMTALDVRATEDIERVTTDIARRVADFLYRRDADIHFATQLKPDAALYRAFVETMRGNIVVQGEWGLDPSGTKWAPVNRNSSARMITSSIPENDRSFNYRPPDDFVYESRPLFLEMTFVGLDGKERVKVVTSPRLDPTLKDVSNRANTYVKAETYFAELKKLRPGEVYVSDVIGAYVGSRVIGTYTPETAAKAGEAFVPEASGYAGIENPLGERFKGIVRWAAPVLEKGAIVGYVTLALDHDHILEFTNHIIPTSQRYTELSDASDGNYAFIWDHKGRSICHARHFSIAGYDPATGDPHIPWLEDRIYEDWKASGKPYAEFIRDVPTFVDQSVTRKPAPELTKQGFVGLDCRYLNFAPQCTGWFDLTQDGGSGSFVILWSGLRKLTTAAAIPYYTGQYAASRRGFGFVAVGAGVDDFHRPATITKTVIDNLIHETDKQLEVIASETQRFINVNLMDTATTLTVSTVLMAVVIILIAIWMASAFTRSITALIGGISRFRSGERHFRFNAPVKDEMGELADSFDEMADAIVNSVNTPLVITDADQKILYMNTQALMRLRLELDDVLGKPYSVFVPHGENAANCPIKSLLEGRESAVYHPQSGGYFQDKASYLTDKNGRNIGFVITTTDVTELVGGQMRLEEQRALLHTTFTASPDIIWYKDSSGRYLAVNPRFASLAGKSPEELIGRTAEEVFPPERSTIFAERDRLAVERRRPIHAEETLLFIDGHEEVVDSVRTPVVDPRTGAIGILGVSRNVTRRVQTEQKLRDMQLELEKAALAANKANESKSEFLARMSHEIRTPMNAVIGMVNIIRRKLQGHGGIDPNDLKSNVRQIEVSSQHLLGLINDILDISKIEAGKIELCAEPFDLAKLIQTVVGIIRPRCTEKNIEFVMPSGLGTDTAFTSDPLRLRQVLINLLGNAVKFTPECGRIEFRASLESDRDDWAYITFLVADTGIGMSDAVQRKLFSPFEQGDSRIAREYGGTGLGLSISRSIVRLMGGDISVESEEGKGSTFSFGLWFQRAAAVDMEEAIQVEGVSLKGRRILLVDDVPINRLIVSDLLEPTGAAVEEAEDGSVALDMVGRSPEGYYDIILMDVQMPRMDGYEAATAIRTLNRRDTATMPIVAMTANAFREDVEKAFASGMNGHMAKPLEFEKLVQIISEQIAVAESTE